MAISEIEVDYTGTDGTTPENHEEFWAEDANGGGSGLIQTNKLKMIIDVNKYANHWMFHDYTLEANKAFDIEVEFSDVSGQTASDQRAGIALTNNKTSPTSDGWATVTRRYTSAGRYHFRYDDGGANDGQQDTATSDNTGKLRVVRTIAGLPSAYYWNGSAWVQFGSSQNWITDEVYFGYYVWRSAARSNIYTMSFDNLMVTGSILGAPGDEMANPVLVDCPEGEWTKVAENVTVGAVHKIFKRPSNYLQTYRMTGEAAPTLVNEGVPMFYPNEITERLDYAAAVDVYLWPTTHAGKVRVDV